MENPRKKAILVVGKMGNGKSSLIKMLTTPQKAQDIKIGNGISNATATITEYPLNPEKGQKMGLSNPQDIVLIDTPGLDSQRKSYLIEEMIDSFIFQHELEIICILNVINPNGPVRLFDENGQSFYHDLHKRLAHPKKIKDQIAYFVFTSFDSFYEKKQKYQTLKKEFSKKSKEYGISNNWQIIPWISEPSQDKEIYNKILANEANQQLQDHYKNQKTLLGNAIKRGLEIWKGHSFQEVKELRKKFQKFEMQKIKQRITEDKKTDLDLQNAIKTLSIGLNINQSKFLQIFNKKNWDSLSWYDLFVAILKLGCLEKNLQVQLQKIDYQRLIKKVFSYFIEELTKKLTKIQLRIFYSNLTIHSGVWISDIKIQELVLCHKTQQKYVYNIEPGIYTCTLSVIMPSTEALRQIQAKSKVEIYYK